MGDVTRILKAIQDGQPQAAEELLPLVYDELRRIAGAKMAREQPGHTLQPTALVHEAWVRLGGDAQPSWQNGAHFFAAAAEAMRRILVDSARRKDRLKRGERPEQEPLGDEALEIAADAPTDEMLAVHDALDRLASEDEVAANVAKLRYFVGLPLPQVAEALEVSPRTASRLWAYARVRLKEIIRGASD